MVYRLAAGPDVHDTARRVHEVHKDYCPVYRSISGSIAVTTELSFSPA